MDKSSDNQLFLNFLGMLRELYLERAMGVVTFKSVVLAGVYDIKNLKIKFRPDEEKKYNSPWNVAVDFPVDMRLSVAEICSMLQAYQAERGISFETDVVSEEIYRYTSGYPFLASLICLWLDERLLERQVLSTPRNQFITEAGTLDMDLVLERFQELMKAEYRKNDMHLSKSINTSNAHLPAGRNGSFPAFP